MVKAGHTDIDVHAIAWGREHAANCDGDLLEKVGTGCHYHVVEEVRVHIEAYILGVVKRAI